MLAREQLRQTNNFPTQPKPSRGTITTIISENTYSARLTRFTGISHEAVLALFSGDSLQVAITAPLMSPPVICLQNIAIWFPMVVSILAIEVSVCAHHDALITTERDGYMCYDEPTAQIPLSKPHRIRRPMLPNRSCIPKAVPSWNFSH